MSNTETWRPVPGWDNLYEVSDLGRVRSLDRIDSRGRPRLGRVRELTAHAGYPRVNLWRDGEFETALVHRLVLTAFAGAPPEGHEARHLNDNPADNRLENLAWGTKSENEQDRLRHGTHNQTSKSQCPAGHPYDLANTYHRPSYPAQRECRACNREKQRRRRARANENEVC